MLRRPETMSVPKGPVLSHSKPNAPMPRGSQVSIGAQKVFHAKGLASSSFLSRGKNFLRPAAEGQVFGFTPEAVFRFSLSPRFEFDVDKINFGTVSFGFLNSRMLTLTNTSEAREGNRHGEGGRLWAFAQVCSPF